MKRIRHLGLAVAMALALTAIVGAGSASASKFVVTPDEWNPEPYPAYVNGNAWGMHELDGGSQMWAKCEQEPDFQSVWLTEPGNTLTPVKQTDPPKCSVFPGGSEEYRPLKFNGCKFIFHTGEELSPGRFGGTVDIGPSGCGPITIVYKWGACMASFYPGTGFGAVFYNEGTGSGATVRTTVDMWGIEYKTTNPKGEVSPVCGEGAILKYGKYKGTWIVSAENELNEPIGLRVE